MTKDISRYVLKLEKEAFGSLVHSQEVASNDDWYFVRYDHWYDIRNDH